MERRKFFKMLAATMGITLLTEWPARSSEPQHAPAPSLNRSFDDEIRGILLDVSAESGLCPITIAGETIFPMYEVSGLSGTRIAYILKEPASRQRPSGYLEGDDLGRARSITKAPNEGWATTTEENGFFYFRVFDKGNGWGHVAIELTLVGEIKSASRADRAEYLDRFRRHVKIAVQHLSKI